jgi:hypothetical protein
MNNLPEGYTLRRCAAGWFVDGLCGYMVTSTYYPRRSEAINRALVKIAVYRELPPAERPAWFVPEASHD